MTTVLEGPPSRAEERSAEAQWAIPQPRARRQKREDGEGKVGAGEAPDSWKVPQLQKSHKGRWIALGSAGVVASGLAIAAALTTSTGASHNAAAGAPALLEGTYDDGVAYASSHFNGQSANCAVFAPGQHGG